MLLRRSGGRGPRGCAAGLLHLGAAGRLLNRGSAGRRDDRRHLGCAAGLLHLGASGRAVGRLPDGERAGHADAGRHRGRAAGLPDGPGPGRVHNQPNHLGAGVVPLSRRPGHGDGLEHRRRPAQLLHHRAGGRFADRQARSHGGSFGPANSPPPPTRCGRPPRRAAHLSDQALQCGPHAGPELRRLGRAAGLRVRLDDGAQRGLPAPLPGGVDRVPWTVVPRSQAGAASACASGQLPRWARPALLCSCCQEACPVVSVPTSVPGAACALCAARGASCACASSCTSCASILLIIHGGDKGQTLCRQCVSVCPAGEPCIFRCMVHLGLGD